MSVIDVIHSPWAIVPERLEKIQEIYHARVNDLPLDWEARDTSGMHAGREPYQVRDGVAVIDVRGVIAQRMNLFSQISGGTSSQLLSRDIESALSDPSIAGIVLAIDSPGGTVAGTPELAAKIMAGRARKPIMAWTDNAMASAAYWIGSAAEKVYISSNVTQVGSIGVVATHKDVSGAEAKAGVKTTEIYAGKYKRIASNYAPLTDEGKAALQDTVDYLYSVFVGHVAEQRGAKVEDVLTRMADGRVFVGKQAIDAGLADGMASLDEVIAMVREKHAASAAQVRGVVNMGLSADDVRKDHPEAAAQIAAQAAVEERGRIKAIQDAALPGHDALVARLIADGVTAEAAAMQLLAAEKQARLAAGAQRQADAPDPLPNAAPRMDDPRPPTAKSREQIATEALAYQAQHGCDYVTALKAVHQGPLPAAPRAAERQEV